MVEQHVDVLIIGAGISGIGAAYHIQKHCPNKSYQVIEARSDLGGTWDLFRYPGIRSDSDMFSFGYHFKPWTLAKIISPAQDIKEYVSEAAKENGIYPKIHFQHKVIKANWDSQTALWTSQIENVQTGEKLSVTSKVFYSCCGYYDYEQGYTPEFAGRESFKGPIIHPQHWPEELDYRDKKIIVIGSGATAITLVPNLAKQASKVTMLQRSPTYIISRPEQDAVANFLRRMLPDKAAYWLSRWKNILANTYLFYMSQNHSKMVKKTIRKKIVEQLGEDYDVDTHFSPEYKPWDQRLCLVPDNDFLLAIKEGAAEVVTDHIETFTEQGIKLKSGAQLEADIIVTATGLNMQILKNIELSVDNKNVALGEHYCYKGMMINDLPNFIFTMGYTNNSWTLKADLVARYACRLINHLDDTQNDYFMPVLPEGDTLQGQPFMNLNSNYIKRAADVLPKQADKKNWRFYHNYLKDKFILGKNAVTDDGMTFVKINALQEKTAPKQKVA